MLKQNRFAARFLLWGLLLLPGLYDLSAQTVFTSVRGYVYDSKTREPLIGAVVALLPDGEPGSITDTTGYFVLSRVPVGYRSLHISYIGYTSYVERDIYVSSGREQVLEFFLQLSDYSLKALTVNTTPATAAELSMVRLQPLRQGERLAGGFNDIGRMLLSYAGVQSILDGSNQIVVRGTGPFGFGWRLNGIPITDPNHFSSTNQSGGAIGLLSTYVLERADFYSGAVPASIGNVLSGVMDMQLRRGDREKFNANLRLGLIGLDAMLEGPFSKKKKASYLANYRYSTITLIEKMGINVHGTEYTSGDISTNFQDLCLGVSIPVGEKVLIQPVLIAGRSRAINGFSPSNSKKEDNFYRMLSTGVSVRHRINEQWQWNGAFANELVEFRLLSARKYNFPFLANFADEEFDSEDLAVVTVNQKLSVDITFRPVARHKINFGGYLQHFDFGLAYKVKNWWGEDLNFDGQADTIYLTGITEAGTGYLNSWYQELFFQWMFMVSPKWSLETGVNFSRSAFNRCSNVEPRFKVNFRPAEKHYLSLATGMQSRMLPFSFQAASITASGKDQPNLDLDFEKVVHVILGYSWMYKPDIVFKLEGYFQHLYAIPAEIPGNPGFDPYYSPLNVVDGWYWKPLASKGKGRNYGVELTMEKVFSRNYYLISTLSLYSSKYKTMVSDWLPTTYDARFIFNISGGRDFTVGKNRNHLISVNSKVIWAGAGRYQEAVDDGSGKFVLQPGYSAWLKDYFRWDVKLAYRKNKANWSWEVSAEVQNLLNRRNEYRKIFDFENKHYNTYYHVGILPVARFSVEL